MKLPDPDQTRDEAGKTVESHDPKKPAGAGKLTPEEQMDLYEKELKENDWGHQPC
jgi:hypothetical protein